MAETIYNEPAFPGERGCDAHNGWNLTFNPGMSLRDYFAAHALPWCLAEFAGNSDDMTQPEAAAYQIADNMLCERAREGADG